MSECSLSLFESSRFLSSVEHLFQFQRQFQNSFETVLFPPCSVNPPLTRDVVLGTRTRSRVQLEYKFLVLVLVLVLIDKVLALVLILVTTVLVLVTVHAPCIAEI